MTELPGALRDLDVSGLRPRHWICVGPGFAREELKAALLGAGQGFVAEAITRVEDLALRIVSEARGAKIGADRLLGSPARQEALRLLLADRRIALGSPELRRLKRQSGFYRKLDRAMQQGRMSFATPEEHSVYLERLGQRFGPKPLREEIERLASAYEAWLEAMELWDPPRLLREATEALESGAELRIRWPEAIVHLCAQSLESLELSFWEAVSREVPVSRQGFESWADAQLPQTLDWSWNRWHTLDDAAEALADELAEAFSREGEGAGGNGAPAPDLVILIPDLPAVRRSISRALRAAGIPLADPRDPTRLRWEEGIKWALSPLEAVAEGYRPDAVIALLRAHRYEPAQFPRWVNEIHSRGIRQGLRAYAGGVLAPVHAFLTELSGQFGGKRSCEEMAQSHLALLSLAASEHSELSWLVSFFEQLWEEFASDRSKVESPNRRAPALYWVERLRARLDEATPPVERLKPSRGVWLHRLGQAPLLSDCELHLFGFPPSWLLGDGGGDYWFSERERETLASEFAVRSSLQVREERLRSLRAWLGISRKLRIHDAAYDWDGRERETLVPALRDLGLLAAGEEAPLPLTECGAHPRWVASFGAERALAPRAIRLEPLSAQGVRELKATELDHYSRCAFIALAQSRWKLWDSREAEAELWPEVRGNILHAAIRILLESRAVDGAWMRSPEDALEEAWKLHPPKGLLRGERLERYVKKKLLEVLLAFCEKEREYFERSGARVLSLEGPELRLELNDSEHGPIAVHGIPDRIDEHPMGLFVMDYKSSSSLPSGKEMVEQGYRLQLPFYALAASRKFGKPAAGVQFIELNRKASRSRGIFFKHLNGKDPGKLTQAGARSGSLIEGEPEDTWSKCLSELETHARSFLAGRFDADPKKPTECSRCRYSDLCGHRRLGAEGGEEPSE